MCKPILTLLTAVFFLAACSTDEASGNEYAAAEIEQSSEGIESESAENMKLQDWSALPEYNTIAEKIGAKSVTFEMVADNPGERVLLLKGGDGNVQYKTIFVKKTKRLKIIHIDGEGLIFNEVLKAL